MLSEFFLKFGDSAILPKYSSNDLKISIPLILYELRTSPRYHCFQVLGWHDRENSLPFCGGMKLGQREVAEAVEAKLPNGTAQTDHDSKIKQSTDLYV